MNLQKGLPWSCLATSFAMVLDIDQDLLFKEVGHNGSEIIFPNLINPFNRRGFHIQEMIDVCWNRGLAVVEFHCVPVSCSHGGNYFQLPINNERRMKTLLSTTQGVLQNPLHSVAWDGKQIFDPKGKILNLDDFDFGIYYCIKDFKNEPLRIPRQSEKTDINAI